MMRPSLFKVTCWLLLIAAILMTGRSKNIPTDTKKLPWDQCIPNCYCSYVDGRKQASCENAGMNEIPTGLSEEIQILELNHNHVGQLKSKIFFSLGLVNLQKIYLKNCSIEEVHKYAFTDLGVIILIDLSDNKIKQLDPATFQGAVNLRYLYVNNNLIKRLENNLFSNLPRLQTIEFNNNLISEIGDRALNNLTRLNVLRFKNNKLVQLQPSVFQLVGEQKLSFDLRNNPWLCDCQLRPFFEYVKRNPITGPTYCNEPVHMQNKDWEVLEKEQFICPSTVIEDGQNKKNYSSEVSKSFEKKGIEVRIRISIEIDDLNPNPSG